MNKITGIILAGGKSRRMGEDKSFVKFCGQPLIEILIDKLSCLFEDLMIVTNKPSLYKKYGLKTQTDIVKDCGPLGGIYTGLLSSGNKYNFVAACDMPFLKQGLIKFILTRISDCDVVIPELNKQLEPLCAVYSKTCLKPIENQLQKNNLKITDFLARVKVRVISKKEIARFDPEIKCFTNINTLKDYQAMIQC